MTDEHVKEKDPVAVELGSRGGAKTSKRYGSSYYRNIQKLSTEAKRAKKLLVDRA